MIQKAVYFSLIYLLITPTLIYYGHIPNAAKWLAEVMAIIFIPVILICLAINKKFYAPLHYLVLIFLLFFIVSISAIYNQSSSSALILGLRHHSTYLPFFLLPLVYNFEEKQIKKILYLMCFFLIIQAPIAFFQRFVWFAHLASGDSVRGTLGGSGTLSVILVSGISVFYSLFLAKQIKLRMFIIISAFLLFPTLINETKATFIMLPIALATATLIFSGKNIFLKIKTMGIYFIVAILFGFIFVNTYNMMYSYKYDPTKRHTPLLEHLKIEAQGEGYVYRSKERRIKRIEEGYALGRMDTIIFAFENISLDPGHLFFGVGIGNAFSTKLSFLQTKNEDILKYQPDQTTITNILWELGVSGLIIHLAFLALMFKDALVMRGQKTFTGVFCLAWCSVIGVRFITLFYQNVFYRNVYDLIFWLLAGIVISKSYQFKMLFHNQQSEVFDMLNNRYETAKS